MHLWDDTKRYLQLPYKKYAYVKDRNGQHISLYGERLKELLHLIKMTQHFTNHMFHQ